MALEFICSKIIESQKKMILPRCANIYVIDSWRNKIEFYYGNPGLDLGLGGWKLPFGAREMEFEFQDDKIGGYIIIPVFYDRNGNLLKIGNR